MAKNKYSKEEKITILKLYHEGKYSLKELAQLFSVNRRTITDWQTNYLMLGEEGLESTSTWRHYTKETKLAAVLDYLSGQYSLREVTRKYFISSQSALRNWIQKYTSHSELNDTGKGMNRTMTKGRKVTFEERIQIVNNCLSHEKNYQRTAEKYDVSYQQVYHWVKKFEATGEEGLKDRRGLSKKEAELTVEDKLRLEMKRIERENERLRAENLFLKKLEEIERRRR